MSKFLTNVHYLEANDIGDDGSVLRGLNHGKKGVVMLQGLFCGHCTTAKPAIQQLANEGTFYVATIQIDGGPTEKEANVKLSKTFGPNFRGVPHYYLIDSSGRFVKHHNGGRSKDDIKTAIESV